MKGVLLAAVFAAGAVYLQWQGIRLNDKEETLRATIAGMESENARQDAENIALKSRIDAIRQHPDELFEELSREKLFMIMPDEIYVLPASESH